jgi:mannose-6-phosphate isomerase-like protein (cupin superfamily)
MKRQSERPANRVEIGEAEWQVTPTYPEPLRSMVRWKTLIGGNQADWIGRVAQQDVILGVLDLDPGGYYPFHAHPAPEIYFILSGTADWTIGDDSFIAVPGMAIYHASNMPHRMVNRGTETLKALWFWWAPDGRNEVLAQEVRFLETAPV